MTKNKSYILALLFTGLLFGTTACEMRDELKGRIPAKGSGGQEEVGAFMLNLSSKEDLTKSSSGKYCVQILNVQGEVVKDYPSFEAMQNEDNTVKLPTGSYKVRSASYAGEVEDATLDKPYFLGEKVFTVKPGEVTQVVDTCKLNNVVVKVNYGDSFLNTVLDNYAVTLTNGIGVLTLDKNVQGTAYFKTTSSMKIAVRATTKSGTEVYKAQLLASADGEPLKPEDLFEINLGIKDTIPNQGGDPTIPEVPTDPEDPDSPDNPDNPGNSGGGFDIIIDVTMNGKDVDIIIPAPGVPKPDPDPTPDPGYKKPSIVGAGFNIDQTLINPTVVKVNITAEAGIKNLFVTIESPILTDEMLEMVGLAKTFDLANPGKYEEALKELGLIGNEAVAGKTSVPFDVSAFMEILSALGDPGPHKFHLRVVDKNGDEASKTLSIKFDL